VSFSLRDKFPQLQQYVDLNGWQVRGFAQEDWILNIRACRIVGRKRFEVGLFLAEDHEKFVRHSGTMAGLVFLLSEAYKKVGRMELHFVDPLKEHEPTVQTRFCHSFPT